MDAVKEFLEKNAKASSTEVCSEVGPEIVQETILPHVHVEQVTAVDRERHIHHHQHRVQPILATEHLAEEHITQVQPAVVQERHEEMSAEKLEMLERLKTQHKNTRTIAATEETSSVLGTTASEHVHHHVHEHITPVIHKETHQHKVVHNVIPIHEKIHEAPIVHESTVLPTLTMDEFRAKFSREIHNHGDPAHSHQFYGGNPKVQDGSASSASYGTSGIPSDSRQQQYSQGNQQYTQGQQQYTQGHQDVEGHNHKTSVGQKAASAVESREQTRADRV